MNQILLVYAATHEKSNSAQIIQSLVKELEGKTVLYNLSQEIVSDEWQHCNSIIFLPANYGDQELHDLFEVFIIHHRHFFEDKVCFVGEIGNYYGYDDLEFGAGRILTNYLKSCGAIVKETLFSIDTLPFLDMRMLEKWIIYLRNTINKHD